MADKVGLSAAQRSRVRRLSARSELAPDEEGGELNIVPFLDIIMNVLMFVLATISVTFTTMIDSSPPRAGGGSARAPDKADARAQRRGHRQGVPGLGIWPTHWRRVSGPRGRAGCGSSRRQRSGRLRLLCPHPVRPTSQVSGSGGCRRNDGHHHREQQRAVSGDHQHDGFAPPN